MSVRIQCEHVVKKYGDLTIIPDLSVDIKEGEFFTLLGPSGCGKTTLLRMIAGFNSIEGGEIKFNDKVINRLPPGQRNIGMVFQNYAIFPHMNVTKNVGFGLTTRHTSKEEIERRVAKIIDTVKIREYKDRMPSQLSGGQQQRVALARAIVIEPDVLLMDEPLSNLDAKLRVEMRDAIRQIQKEINITTVYVTHDQEEAMAVSDRIAVMSSGVIQQVGRPRDIYLRPANVFVATFMGKTTIIDAVLSGSKDAPSLKIDNYTLDMKGAALNYDGTERKVKVSVRPEDFYAVDASESSESNCLAGVIRSHVMLGLYTENFVKLDSGKVIQFMEMGALSREFSAGEAIKLKIHADRVNVYTEDGLTSLTVKAQEAGLNGK